MDAINTLIATESFKQCRRWMIQAQAGRRVAVLLATALLGACGSDAGHSGSATEATINSHSSSQASTSNAPVKTSDFDWQLPDGVAMPLTQAHHPMTEARFQLGRHLFYDTRLSAEGNIACASCHHQDKAFTDGRVRPVGTYGQVHPRNAQSLGNTAWFGTLNWANPVTVTLERQIRVPLFGDDPFEHGIEEHNQHAILADLTRDPTYQSLLQSAFPGEQRDWNFINHIIPALAAFVRGMTSFDSPWDHYLQGNQAALTPAAQRGMALFTSAELGCSQCHTADHFLTDSHVSVAGGKRQHGFHNNAAVGQYRYPNTGRHEATGKPEDLGLFRTPSLRNIALTAPYMHDGSFIDLRSVIASYAKGGNQPAADSEAAGHSGIKDPLITGFDVSEAETNDLMAFLCSLTDERFITNPRYANPWPVEAVENASVESPLQPPSQTQQYRAPGVAQQCQSISM